MLQQGRYVADVAYFIGEDAPKMTGECNPPLPFGYSFDYINAEVLMKHSRVENGRLVLDSGMEYRILVLPDQETMRPELLGKIKSLVAGGLVITGPAPVRSPSMEDYPVADAKVRDMAAEMWGGSSSPRDFGKGKVYPSGTSLETIFKDMEVAPDFSLAPGQGDILFIHRTLDENGTAPDAGEIWFVSNQRDGENHIDMSFRVSGMVPQFWNPATGECVPAGYTARDGRIHVHADLEPLESVFVVFGKDKGPDHIYETEDVMPVHTPWEVTFNQDAEFCADGKDTSGAFSVEYDFPEDWSLSDDERIKYYSGTAVYRTDVEVEKKAGCRYVLDLGKVMVMAKVKVNGKYAGGVWTDPYSLDVTDFIRDGRNKIEISVANNWMNRLVKDASMPEDERRTWTNINPYGPDSPLQLSGLIGPVSLKIKSPVM